MLLRDFIYQFTGEKFVVYSLDDSFDYTRALSKYTLKPHKGFPKEYKYLEHCEILWAEIADLNCINVYVYDIRFALGLLERGC